MLDINTEEGRLEHEHQQKIIGEIEDRLRQLEELDVPLTAANIRKLQEVLICPEVQIYYSIMLKRRVVNLAALMSTIDPNDVVQIARNQGQFEGISTAIAMMLSFAYGGNIKEDDDG